MTTIKRIYTVVAVTFVLAGTVGGQVVADNPEPPMAPAAPHAVSAPEPPFVDRFLGALPYGPLSSTQTPPLFIVPDRQMTVEDLTAISEDITVMRRIFENRLKQAKLLSDPGPAELLYRGFRGGDGNSLRSMYLQGYGVLFMVNVALPLEPGPDAETEELVQPQEGEDPVWVRTREEIYQPQKSSRRGVMGRSGPSRGAMGESRPKYSAEQVETLKRTIIDALVHAANIRHLATDEAIVVTLTGTSTLPGELAARRTLVVPQSHQDEWLSLLQGDGVSDTTAHSRTVLTIRAKRSDIAALAEGDLTDEQFRQRVQVLSHPLLGEGTALPM